VERAGGQTEWCRQTGLNLVNLNKVLNGKKRPISPIYDALNIPAYVFTRRGKQQGEYKIWSRAVPASVLSCGFGHLNLPTGSVSAV
jgi:hypothetical protein